MSSDHREKVAALMSGSDDSRRRKYIRRAVESAYEYNVFLNRTRQRVFIDMQTDTPNYPVGLGRQNKTLTRTEKVGRFPVAVMPSQYQDWFIEYTPEELQYLPVDTVLKGPIMRIDQLPPVLTTPDVSEFDSDSDSCCSTSSEDCSSCCSCCAQRDAATVAAAAAAATPANATSVVEPIEAASAAAAVALELLTATTATSSRTPVREQQRTSTKQEPLAANATTNGGRRIVGGGGDEGPTAMHIEEVGEEPQQELSARGTPLRLTRRRLVRSPVRGRESSKPGGS